MTKYIQDYYGILGVEPDADNKTIKDAYECNIKKYHPNVNNGAKAQRKYELSKEAYEVLSDADKRKKYDVLRQKAIANQKKKEEEEKAKQDFDYKKSAKNSKSSFKGKKKSAFKGRGRSKSSAFDLLGSVGKSGNIGKAVSLGSKAGKASPLLSLSKVIVGGTAAAYGVKKGRDYISRGGKNQK